MCISLIPSMSRRECCANAVEKGQSSLCAVHVGRHVARVEDLDTTLKGGLGGLDTLHGAGVEDFDGLQDAGVEDLNRSWRFPCHFDEVVVVWFGGFC